MLPTDTQNNDPGLLELEQLAIAAGDALADLSAEYERRGPWGNSVPVGSYSPIRAVTARQWTEALHAMIDTGDLDGLRGRTVSRDYLHRLGDELATAADYATGRNCMPGHEELGAALGRPVKAAKRAAMALMTPAAQSRAQARIDRDRARQVTNALNVLKAAGVLVCLEEGRMLTYVEKVELYANGEDRRYARARHRDRNRPIPTRLASSHPASGTFVLRSHCPWAKLRTASVGQPSRAAGSAKIELDHRRGRDAHAGPGNRNHPSGRCPRWSPRRDVGDCG